MKRKSVFIVAALVLLALIGIGIYFFINTKTIKLYRIQKDGVYGYIDSLGTELIKPQYLYATNFRDGLALVVVDTTIIRFKKDYTSCKNNIDSLIYDFKNSQSKDTIIFKYGYVNCFNKIVIDTTLLLYDEYNSDLNPLIKNGDLNLSNYLFSNKLAVFQSIVTKKYGYINNKGKIVIPANFLFARNFSNDLAAVNFAKTVEDKNTWGYINSEGSIVIKPRFSAAEDFSEGYAVTNLFKTENVNNKIMKTELNFNWIIINKSGNMIGEPINGFFSRPIGFVNGICPVEQKFLSQSLGWKFMDINGKYTSDFNMSDITRYYAGYAGVKTKDGWVFVDKQLKIKSKYYECVNPFIGNLAPVKEGGKWGYIDTTFQTVIPNHYDTCGVFRGALATFRIKSQSLIIDGYINKKGVIVWQNETYKFDGK
jgi:hypothetical protein